MKKLIILFVCCISFSLANAQQETTVKFNNVKSISADKVKLNNGIKIESNLDFKKLKKAEPTTVSTSSDTKESHDIEVKKEKINKPSKILKYGASPRRRVEEYEE